MPTTIAWTAERIAEARTVAGQRDNRWGEVAAALSERWGCDVTKRAAKSALERASVAVVTTREARPQVAPARPAVRSPEVARLVELAKRYQKRGGLTLEAVANALDVSPAKARSLVERVHADGYTIDVVHGELTYKLPEPNADTLAIAPSAQRGSEHAIGVISDLHFGSRYNLGAQMRAFVEQAYADGIRDFFCPGDVLEGCYRHAQWELSHRAWDEQAQSFLDHFPALPGANLYWIDGNHDWTWTERDGYESGRKLLAFAREQGRTGLHYLGARGALVDYGGTKIELFHPKKGAAYALSYQLQNKIRDTAPERLPDILLCGHVHQYVKFRRQNVWAFYCGTWQHGDGPYGRSLGGDTATGGTIIRWRKDSDGVVRHLSDQFHVADHVPQTHAVRVAQAEAA